MGIIPPPEKCFITGQPTTNIPSDMDWIEYRVDFAGQNLKFVFAFGYKNSQFIESNLHILRGLIADGKWTSPKDSIYNKETLESIINEAYYPKTPKEKLDNIMLLLYRLQDFDGQRIHAHPIHQDPLLFYKLYLKSENEYHFYLKTLAEMGYIEGMDATTRSGDAFMITRLTYTGIEYVISIQEEGQYSRNCFVAMSFGESMKETREEIRSVCQKLNYNAIFIDEVHYESDQTINDAIIAFIKRSRFCIADFTEQKFGVYFEAGYSLGRGIPVIYSCHKDWFKESHFDTNHFPHIIYTNKEELNQKLTEKIQAWID